MMKPSLNLRVAIALIFSLPSGCAIQFAHGRTWTSNDGKTIEAEFIGVSGDSVLISHNGRAVAIPLERLSDADQKWVAEQPTPGPTPGDRPDDDKIAHVTQLLERSLESAELSDQEREDVASFVARLLPEKGGAGESVEWEVDFPKWSGDSERKSVLLSADMFPAGTRERQERLMWFHIVFLGKEKEGHSGEKFGRYPAMSMEGRHLFVSAGRTSVRAVADAESYQNDERIRAVMKGIDLETIAKF